jgi:hypothetical protein
MLLAGPPLIQIPGCTACRLQKEVLRLQRNARREGANLEYLKNVVLKFLESSVGREQYDRRDGHPQALGLLRHWP